LGREGGRGRCWWRYAAVDIHHPTVVLCGGRERGGEMGEVREEVVEVQSLEVAETGHS
jgi:hypothetical protein